MMCLKRGYQSELFRIILMGLSNIEFRVKITEANKNNARQRVSKFIKSTPSIVERRTFHFDQLITQVLL